MLKHGHLLLRAFYNNHSTYEMNNRKKYKHGLGEFIDTLQLFCLIKSNITNQLLDFLSNDYKRYHVYTEQHTLLRYAKSHITKIQVDDNDMTVS